MSKHKYESHLAENAELRKMACAEMRQIAMGELALEREENDDDRVVHVNGRERVIRVDERRELAYEALYNKALKESAKERDFLGGMSEEEALRHAIEESMNVIQKDLNEKREVEEKIITTATTTTTTVVSPQSSSPSKNVEFIPLNEVRVARNNWSPVDNEIDFD